MAIDDEASHLCEWRIEEKKIPVRANECSRLNVLVHIYTNIHLIDSNAHKLRPIYP